MRSTPQLKVRPLLGATHPHFSGPASRDLEEVLCLTAGELPLWDGEGWDQGLVKALPVGVSMGHECHLGMS